MRIPACQAGILNTSEGLEQGKAAEYGMRLNLVKSALPPTLKEELFL